MEVSKYQLKDKIYTIKHYKNCDSITDVINYLNSTFTTRYNTDVEYALSHYTDIITVSHDDTIQSIIILRSNIAYLLYSSNPSSLMLLFFHMQYLFNYIRVKLHSDMQYNMFKRIGYCINDSVIHIPIKRLLNKYRHIKMYITKAS